LELVAIAPSRQKCIDNSVKLSAQERRLKLAAGTRENIFKRKN